MLWVTFWGRVVQFPTSCTVHILPSMFRAHPRGFTIQTLHHFVFHNCYMPRPITFLGLPTVTLLVTIRKTHPHHALSFIPSLRSEYCAEYSPLTFLIWGFWLFLFLHVGYENVWDNCLIIMNKTVRIIYGIRRWNLCRDSDLLLSLINKLDRSFCEKLITRYRSPIAFVGVCVILKLKKKN
jgi:hypothetical protein